MVLNHCTVCAVYESDQGKQKRIQIKCDGGRILLLLNREQEVSDEAKVRIDFFDSQIGCVKAYCGLNVRRNYDSSIQAPWLADCEVLEVIEIVEGRRSVRLGMEKETVFTDSNQEEYTGVIQNIGEGGIYFITWTKQQCGELAEFSYCPVETEYRMKVNILREETFRDGRYGYGCQFVDYPKGAERDIKRYLIMRQSGRIW